MLNIKVKEMGANELRNIIGGTLGFQPEVKYKKVYHKGCGGEILNVGDIFQSCVCERCGETNYWCASFDYYTED